MLYHSRRNCRCQAALATASASWTWRAEHLLTLFTCNYQSWVHNSMYLSTSTTREHLLIPRATQTVAGRHMAHHVLFPLPQMDLHMDIASPLSTIFNLILETAPRARPVRHQACTKCTGAQQCTSMTPILLRCESAGDTAIARSFGQRRPQREHPSSAFYPSQNGATR